MNSPDLMLFEPNLGGHHAEFTCHILWHWNKERSDERLVAALAPGLLEQQPGLSSGVVHPPQTSVVLLDGPLPGALKGNWAKGRSNWRLLADAIARHRPKQVLIMYLDHAQLGLALGLRFDFPVTISGILFHPTLHYRTSKSWGFKAQIQRMRKRVMLRLMGRNPHLGTVFTLDPSAVESLRLLGLDASSLEDPIIQEGLEIRTPEEMRKRHGIEPGRKVLLLFGALTARKGVIPLLRAVASLPPRAAREVALLMAGPLDASLGTQLADLVSSARRAGIQVKLHNAQIPNGHVQSYMESADLVLAPYQRHFGSSAILIRAALAQRPVLSQSFGLMGDYVREHRLGQSVDTGNSAEIAAGIEAFLSDPTVGFDPVTALRFAKAHTPERFCQTISYHLFSGQTLKAQLAHQS